jgi:hypothetical protein
VTASGSVSAVFDRETLDGIIRMLMRIDANVAELVPFLR